MTTGLLQIDWADIFTPETSLREAVLRGTLVCFALLLFRLTPRRTIGSIGVMDLVVIILIADAAGNVMGEGDSATSSFVLVRTLVGWGYVLNWLTYRVPAVNRLVWQPALPVVPDGR